MAGAAIRRDVAVSMRFREDDLGIIDRGAELDGLSRTEFVRRAALHKAQIAILNETVLRFSPEAFDDFVAAIDAPPHVPPPAALKRRLERKAPWETGKA